MKLTYYPGCSLTGSAREYDHSIRELCRLLDVQLEDLNDWNCCGASSAHMTDHRLALELSARNLLLARDQGQDVLVPCAACFQRLRSAEKTLKEKPGQLGVDSYDPGFEIVHLTTLLSSKGMLAKIGGMLARDLAGLKVACYYGCLSLRPPKVTGANRYEDPLGLDLIVEALGAQAVRWSHKTECCSGSLTMPRPDIAGKLVGDIVEAAKRAGAQALVVDCPMCQANLESRQDAAMPVFFASELVVLALQGKSKKKQWKKHLVDPGAVLSPLGW